MAGFIERWVSGPMFARLADAAQTVERRRNSATGLAWSLRLAGTGTQEPLWDRIPKLAVPLAIPAVRLAVSDNNGRQLLPMLAITARLQLAVGLLLTIGLLLVRP